MGDPGVAPFGLLMVHGRGSGMSRDLPVEGPCTLPMFDTLMAMSVTYSGMCVESYQCDSILFRLIEP